MREHRVQASWNTVYEGQKDWEPLVDPESGPLETSFSMWELTGPTNIVPLVADLPAHGGYSSYIDTTIDLKLGAKYLMKVEFRSKATLTAVAYSEPITADFTLPVVQTPRLEAATDAADDQVIGRWVFPPGGSPWGGIRGVAWVGERIHGINVLLGDEACIDPESGVHQLNVSIGSRRDAADVSPWLVATGLERATVDLPRSIGDHGTLYYMNAWCMNGAAQSIGANPAAEFMVDGTPPLCIKGVAVVGEGLYFHSQANASRLLLTQFTGAMTDQETGIGLVEYVLHDLSNGSSTPLPQLSHYGLPPKSFYALSLQLQHNHRYTVTATPRNGVNGLGTVCSSSVTLVDLTPPIAGGVYVVHSDMDAFVNDLEREPLAAHYQYSTLAIRITTRRFTDNESVSATRFDPALPVPERPTSCVANASMSVRVAVQP